MLRAPRLSFLAISFASLCVACGSPSLSPDNRPDGQEPPSSADAGPTSRQDGGGAEDASCEASSDSNHCGQCGRSCHGTACSNGQCETIELYRPERFDNTTSLALYENNIYFSSAYGQLLRVGRDGGPATVLADDEDIAGIAVSDDVVYWTSRDPGEIRAVPVLGGTVLRVASVPGRPYGLTAHDGEGFLYVANRETGELVRVDRTNGDVTVVAVEAAHAVASDDRFVVWTNKSLGTVRVLDKNTGDLSTVAEEQSEPTRIAIADAYVYWTNTGAQPAAIVRAPVLGGTIELVVQLEGSPCLTTDAIHVYCTAEDSVYRAPISGGSPLLLAGQRKNPCALAFDDKWLYIGDFNGGGVYKTAK